MNKLPYKCDYCGGQLEAVYYDEEKGLLVRCSVCRRWKWWNVEKVKL